LRPLSKEGEFVEMQMTTFLVSIKDQKDFRKKPRKTL